MSGMGTGSALQTSNALIVAAFHHGLLIQLALVLTLIAVGPFAWSLAKPWLYRRGYVRTGGGVGTAAPFEPPARKVLRLGFGLIWLLDGLLQAQSAMPVGLPTQVVSPATDGSPAWLVHLVGWATTGWQNHPLQAAEAAVWVQIAIGVWLLLVPRGRASQLAGLVSVGWALVVWVFGEAMGGILAPGPTWLFGAPGAAVFYAGAGVLIALPLSAWRNPALGRWLLRGIGAFLTLMAGLQAWPGRGFWQGGSSGGLPSMVSNMAQTPQPRPVVHALHAFGGFSAAHGFAVNLFVVVALAAIGLGLLSGRRSLVLPAVGVAIVLCLADWVLVEDFGFFGGVGTDPNSALPQVLLLVGGYLALTRPAVAPAAAPAGMDAALAASAGMEPVAATVEPRPVPTAVRPREAALSMVAGGVVMMMFLGVVPMASAMTAPDASPIISEAINGAPSALDSPAPNFHLVDQNGDPVSLSALRGRAVALTFLDPVCTSDCPLIAQQLRQADQQLGSRSSRAEVVVVCANPVYNSTADLRAFDAQEGLTHIDNWVYLTGTPRQLERVWGDYNVQVTVSPDGAMVDHSEVVYVIGPSGRLRWVLNDDPINPNTASDAVWAKQAQSSFALTVAQEIKGLVPGR